MFNHIMAAEDGRIYSTYSSAQATILVSADTVDPQTQWYDWSDRSVKAKEEMSISVTPTQISEVPTTCTCSVTGPITTSIIVPEGTHPALFDAPGSYELIFTSDSPRYLPLRVELVVPELSEVPE